MSKKILVINGPNLNMLGKREADIYGKETLEDVERRCRKAAESLGFAVEFFQSNSEGELVTRIQQAKGAVNGIVINAGAYTHTSVAIYDALSLTGVPFVEVHISNIFKREEFRHHSYISPIASGIICGLGTQGYELAIAAFKELQG